MLNLAAVPQSATLGYGIDDDGDIFVNGTLVVSDHYGFANGGLVDIGAYFIAGANVIAFTATNNLAVCGSNALGVDSDRRRHRLAGAIDGRDVAAWPGRVRHGPRSVARRALTSHRQRLRPARQADGAAAVSRLAGAAAASHWRHGRWRQSRRPRRRQPTA